LAEFRRHNGLMDDTEAAMSSWPCFSPRPVIPKVPKLDPELISRRAAADAITVDKLRESLV